MGDSPDYRGGDHRNRVRGRLVVAGVTAGTQRGIAMLRRDEAVLIVDDDEAVRGLLARMVELLGYQVETAANGAEALAAFIARDGRYAAVLLDAMMPVMDGAEALHCMREIRPETPVVCVSGYRDEELAPFFGDHAPDGFVTKPCSTEQIRAALWRFAPRSWSGTPAGMRAG